MNAWAQSTGQPGLGYIFWRKEGDKLEGAGPLAKNIGEERTDAIRTQLGLDDGDACFFVAGDPAKFYKFAGEARTKAGEELNLVDRDRFELCWIVDFPFFEWSEEDKKVDFAHNPFSMPLMRKDPTYLEKNAIRLLDGKGNEVAPETIDWNGEAPNLMFRQDPGKTNAMRVEIVEAVRAKLQTRRFEGRNVDHDGSL